MPDRLLVARWSRKAPFIFFTAQVTSADGSAQLHAFVPSGGGFVLLPPQACLSIDAQAAAGCSCLLQQFDTTSLLAGVGQFRRKLFQQREHTAGQQPLNRKLPVLECSCRAETPNLLPRRVSRPHHIPRDGTPNGCCRRFSGEAAITAKCQRSS